ncbi:MAG: hypothetical protein IT355_10090 [Gemmatimonadaceae bacterium]|nr:hypothetical protein [Gemmatimonadaceae bacterium]
MWIHGDGHVILGNRVILDASAAPIELFPWAGAEIVIGDDCVLEGGTSIEATRSIRIGSGARIGSFARIMDSHFHALVGDRHVRPEPQPVVLEDDVQLGPRCVVLAGSRIACGARITAATVVRRPSRRQAPATTRTP